LNESGKKKTSKPKNFTAPAEKPPIAPEKLQRLSENPGAEPASSPAESDEELFMRHISGVSPLSSSKEHEPRLPGPLSGPPSAGDPDAVALELLKQLIEGGGGFVVSHTGEYIEGTGYGIHPDMAKRLHSGEFSIQAHLDLHGMLAEEADEALDDFLARSLTLGLRAVLVVHGRGRSSKNEPVLKNRVIYRLTKGAWRKWVIAFSSARSCDGGAGATYVLFRDRPVTSKARKKRP
jgi:DNA-nicking Smr family endonuclease